MGADQGKARDRAGLVDGSPVVVRVQRCAVIDEPGPPLPHEQIRVVRRAVGIGGERVEPDDTRSELGRDEVAGGDAVEVEGTLEVACADVRAVALAQQVLNLRIRLTSAEAIPDVDERELGDGQAEVRREEADDELGHQHLRPLPRATELHDIESTRVGLDHGGKRASLAQGLHVSRGGVSGELR
jgi:hypothetical protein